MPSPIFKNSLGEIYENSLTLKGRTFDFGDFISFEKEVKNRPIIGFLLLVVLAFVVKKLIETLEGPIGFSGPAAAGHTMGLLLIASVGIGALLGAIRAFIGRIHLSFEDDAKTKTVIVLRNSKKNRNFCTALHKIWDGEL